MIAQAEVEFELKEMEGHATNVHYFGGIQFQQFGLHHVEIFLEDELRLRFSLQVVRLIAATATISSGKNQNRALARKRREV